MQVKSIFSIVTAITTAKPNLSEKVTLTTQNYAQFKLNSKELVTLRKEKCKGVSLALVLRNKNGKIIASGLKEITKKLEE